MSVIKSKRGKSNVQFLDTAFDLQVLVIKTCVNFPKKYTFHLTQKIAKLAISCHVNVKNANNIFPKNEHEAQRRKDYLDNALGNLYNLSTQLDIAFNLFEIEEKKIVAIIELVYKEINLLKSLKKSDAHRFSFSQK